MVKLSEKQTILAICGGGLALCLAAGGGIWWAYGLIDEERAAIASEEQKIAAANVKIEKIPALEQDVIELRENVEHYVKILPEQSDINNFIRTTNKFEQQSGVHIERFTDGKPGRSGKFANYAYRIELTGTIWQFLKFMNLFENHDRFVRVTSFQLRREDRRGSEQELGAEAEHKITMGVETYVYLGGNQKNEVNIPNYAAKRDKLREKIYNKAQTIQLAKYEYKDSQGRRDIFVDPRQGEVVVNNRPLEQQKTVIEEYTAKVEELQKLYDHSKDDKLTYLEKAQLEKTITKHLEELQAGIEDVAVNNVITWPPFHLRWNNQVLQPLKRIQEAVTGGSGSRIIDRYLTEEQLADLHNTMRQDLERGDLESARERHEATRDKLSIPPEDSRYPWVERIAALRLLVDTMIDFSSLRLDISGVVVNGSGKSGILLNGEVVEEGDYINENLLLKAVANERATFVYKGFSVVKTW